MSIRRHVLGGPLQLSAVILARVLAYIEVVDLNPRGTIFFPELVQELVKRYKFQKYPQNIDEFDESKGVEFHQGVSGGNIIQKFVIWNTLLVVETRSNTTDSKEILQEMLQWGAARFKLNYKTETLKKFAYVSDVTFYSDAPLLGASPAIARLSANTSEAISEIWQEPIRYDPMIVTVGHDPMARKYPIAPFTIQRRAEARFSENKYFSEAPLPTDLHLTLLAKYENDVLSQQ